VEHALRVLNAHSQDAAVAVIGHSTRRNPESRRATEAQAQALRAAGVVAQVTAVYLDDSPEIAEAYSLTSAPNLIAVPYFLALGSHTTIDVPARLGLSQGQTRAQIDGRTVYYTAPVGTDDALLTAILELAKEANPDLMSPLFSRSPKESLACRGGSETRPQGNIPDSCSAKITTASEHKERAGLRPAPTQIQDNAESAWHCFPSAGREAFIETVVAAGEIRFGQLRVTPPVIHVWGDEHPDQIIDSPAELRAKVREQPFRPLATSTDLPGGWRIEIQSPDMMHAVVETIYPGLIADWSGRRHGTFAFNRLEETAARQMGMFRPLDQLNFDQRQRVVETVCARCVRHPTWFYGETPLDALPCPEACSVWLSRALEEQ
jgi:sirohydrochlorin cobaltochelatase